MFPPKEKPHYKSSEAILNVNYTIDQKGSWSESVGSGAFVAGVD